MLTIYGVCRLRASRTFWLVGELGLAFRHVPVVQAYRLADPNAGGAPFNTRSPEFLRLNPNGHIPSIDDDGFVLNESLAINLYLAKKHGGALAPANVAEDGAMMMWALWAATEVEPHALNVLYHRLSYAEAKRDANIAAAAVAALKAPFAVFDRALATTGFAVGSRFTVADINLAEVFRYAMPAPELFQPPLGSAAWLRRLPGAPRLQGHDGATGGGARLRPQSGTRMVARSPPMELTLSAMSPPWLRAISRAIARPRPELPASWLRA